MIQQELPMLRYVGDVLWYDEAMSHDPECITNHLGYSSIDSLICPTWLFEQWRSLHSVYESRRDARAVQTDLQHHLLHMPKFLSWQCTRGTNYGSLLSSVSGEYSPLYPPLS